MDARRRPLLRSTSLLLLVAQLVAAVPSYAAVSPAKPAESAPQPAAPKRVANSTKPSALVARAQGFYRDGRYDEAVGLLAGPVLRKELAGDELRGARLMLARCYVKKGMLPRAKEHFGAVLASEPAFVLTAGYDVLCDDGRAYAATLQAAGVAVEHAHYPGMIHGFITMGKIVRVANDAVAACAHALKRGFV